MLIQNLILKFVIIVIIYSLISKLIEIGGQATEAHNYHVRVYDNNNPEKDRQMVATLVLEYKY